MSTRSNIGIKRKNGNIEVVYCHNDGYLSYNGKILLENYQDLDKVNSLIDLGDMSYLKEDIESTCFYGRNRGEEETKVCSCIYNNLENYLKNVDSLFIEYIYLFDETENKWEYAKSYFNQTKEKYCYTDFKELTTEIIEMESRG